MMESSIKPKADDRVEVRIDDASTDAALRCAACGEGAIENLGPLRHRHSSIAGVPVDLSSINFAIRRCTRCGFRFKTPRLSERTLLDCYERASATNWAETPDPRFRRFDTLRAILESHAPGRRILDIGCFHADFLRYLGPSWERFGVEPSAAAAAIAQGAGVTMLGQTAADVDASMQRFDAIIALDVLEHLPAPATLFADVSSLLRPGGVFLVMTGDTDSFGWRMEGNSYWYSGLPEHVSFYNRSSMNALAREAGLPEVEYRRVCHVRPSLPFKLAQGAKNSLYIAGLANEHVIGRHRTRLTRHGIAPSWISSSDHLISVFSKRP